jgi:6-phosphogluconolactonase
VPPNDPESNFAPAARHLLAPLKVAEDCIHRIPVERGEAFAVAHAEAELCRVADMDNQGVPLLDLVFLGMGEDGHTASLFPGDEDMLSSPAVYRAITGPKPPPRRVTLGLPVLAAAREVWVVATGAGKAAALRASLTGGGTPLAHVLSARTHTGIFTDFDLA